MQFLRTIVFRSIGLRSNILRSIVFRVLVGQTALAVLFFACLPVNAQPTISEFLADNQSGLVDEDGDESDWIELQLTGSTALDVEGWYLTDDPTHQQLWRLPSRTLEPGEFLLVFASGKNRTDGELHTDFRLDSGGEHLALIEPDGTTVAVEFAPYPPQRADVSFGTGRGTIGDSLVPNGATAVVHVPVSDVLERGWTGGAEPFDDSDAAGWFAATLGIGFPSDTAGVSADEPIAYWSFDAGTTDDSGNGHTAIAQGAVTSTDASPAGVGGRSLRFDGIDDYVSAELDVSETQYTSSLWFKTSSPGGGLFAVVQDDLGGGGHDRHIYMNGGNVATRVWNTETIVSSALDLADGQWHHVAHVVSPLISGQRIYIDGVLVASGQKSTSDFDWQERINIGFSNDAANTHFDGFIDEVAVWNRALNLQQIRALANGALPSALAGVAPFIASDIGDAIGETRSSVYVRIPFELDSPPEFNGMELRVRYEDGFVAYLNGVQVATRNAPEVVAFDSLAVSDRSVQQAVRLESVDLSEHVDVLSVGQNILAIHLLNDAADSADLLFAPELLAVEESVDRFFGTPTPGSPNDSGVTDFVADTQFSLDRGTYDEPFDVEITTATEAATIWYTTDGSVPSPDEPNAEEYTGPIRIEGTTTLRARAFREGFEPTNTDTQTYIFIADTLRQPAQPPGVPATWAGGFRADYGVDPDVVNTALPGYSVAESLVSLPTISVVTDPANLFDTATGIYANSSSRGPSWERPASFELFYPDGTKSFQIDAGIRMHGNSSRQHGFTPKHPIRVLFKRKYGAAKLKEKVFPDSEVDRFDLLLLRGASTDSWPVTNGNFVLGVQRWSPLHATYIRDQWMRDAQNSMGHPSGHGIYAQLYLNGIYWGLYNLAERPTNSFNAEYFGGEKEEYDVMKDFAELQAGTRTAWDQMIQLAGAGLSSNAAYQRIQGRNPDGSPNPDFPNYIDVDNLIDYMILHIASGSEDWPDHNWWAARRRGPESEGFRFFVWDQEISNDSLIRTHTRISTPFAQPVSNPSPSYVYGRLRANATFREKFIDRVHWHLYNDGLLSPEKNQARWQRLQDTIDLGIVGESARWGDTRKAIPYKREVEWLAEMDFMRDEYWPQIRPIATERFRDVDLYPDTEAPVYLLDGVRQHGGAFREGQQVTVIVPAGERFIDELIIDRDSPVSAFVPTDNSLGEAWRAYDYLEGSRGETWRQGSNGVGYERSSGYEDVISIDVEDAMYGAEGNTSVFVRIAFEIPNQASIDAIETLVLRIAADDGFEAWLNEERVAGSGTPSPLEWDSSSTAGGETSIDAAPEFDLSAFVSSLRVGENVLAIQGLNFSNTSSDMLVLAELLTRRVDTNAGPGDVFYTIDGSDPRDPAAQLFTTPLELSATTLLKSRTLEGGEWSALTEALFSREEALPLRVTELMYHPPSPLDEDAPETELFEFIELQNIGNQEIVLSGVQIVGAVDFEFSRREIITLGPREHVVLVKNVDAFVSLYGEEDIFIAGEYSGRFDNGGETITLLGPRNETISEFTYDDLWYSSTDGMGNSLVIRNPFSPLDTWSESVAWRPSLEVFGNPGFSDGDIGEGGLIRIGDSNRDGNLDLSDGVNLLLRLFSGSNEALPCDGETLDSGANLVVFDINDDDAVNLTDAIFLLEYLFRGGSPPTQTGCVFVENCLDTCIP